MNPESRPTSRWFWKELPANDALSSLGLSNPRVDPLNPAFDFTQWSRTIAHLRDQLGVAAPPRSGFLFRHLTVVGSGPAVAYQDTVWTALVCVFNVARFWKTTTENRVILRDLDGVVQKGELLLVLGRPGSGCSTFLKTIAGHTAGLKLDPNSAIEYRGVPYESMTGRFRGELIYTQENEDHFPYLTVEQTLEFAAAMRTPRSRLPGVTRATRIRHVVDVVLTAFGLSHVRKTIVGDDYVRGVSGGERRRVSIAEAAVAEAAVSAWDNPTRGLDAGSALTFVHHLRTLSDLTSSCTAAAIYQSSEAIFERFDKVLVLYDGRQIYFGPARLASGYFERMGWRRHPRQTTADFLTTVTNPAQRQAKEGLEGHTPETAEEFEKHWRDSEEYTLLRGEMVRYQQEWDAVGDSTLLHDLEEARRRTKQRFMLSRAPQMVSFITQTHLCATRTCLQLWNDRASTFTALGGEIVIALVVGSIFYGMENTTERLFSLSSVLFFSVLLNTLIAITDIHGVYARRAVIRKHVSRALYRPSADALGTVLVDIPVKFCIATCFNLTLYFLAGLAATASQFFIFFLFVFTATMAMSMLFRCCAAVTTTLVQALAAAGLILLGFITYAGFVLPTPSMPPWFKWIWYINPLAYAFEALLVNQAHASFYPCADLVPSYQDMVGSTFICPVPGAVAGETQVSGDRWFEEAFGYSYSHLWRNLGIILGFAGFLFLAYLAFSEWSADSSSASNLPVVKRGRPKPPRMPKGKGIDDHHVEALVASSNVIFARPLTAGQKHHPSPQIIALPTREHSHTFSWHGVCLEVKIQHRPKRLLDNVSGYVQSGTLTALMGVSGAGKTTLLNALAQRLPAAGADGEFLMGSNPISVSEFKRSVAYVQQQDVHLETSTVREALQFSALLRQDVDVPRHKKLECVEDVIARLGMDEFADMVIGTPGMGLTLEQRKRLSIGVELAANPLALLFLDEPTSGLDGPSSDAIVALLQKLAKTTGLAILCTIHQPSAMLFQKFDQVLLMTHGGKTAYFGPIGTNSETVLDYFSRNGHLRFCSAAENPAEYLLDVIGTAGSASSDGWPEVWGKSDEARRLTAELDHLKTRVSDIGPTSNSSDPMISDGRRETAAYALPLLKQFPIVCRRVSQQYWRSPAYILSKFMLGTVCSLLVGFSFFQVDPSIAGSQDGIFSVLLFCATFNSLAQQAMPKFLVQRTIYEVRERHSKTYSWIVLLLANVLVELPYNIMLGIVSFAAYNYAVFGIEPSGDQVLILLFAIYFYVLSGTFAQMVMAALPDTTTAGRVATILFAMMILFAGVFQTPADLPRFWIFMYRVSPLTYLVAGMSTAGLGISNIVCSQNELAVFQPRAGETCGEYLAPYLHANASGTLLNPEASADCAYCPLRSTSQVLARFGMFYEDRWVDWAIGFAFLAFNIGCMLLLYYMFRVRTWGNTTRKIKRLWRRLFPVGY
ncbi:hypothetical protein OQA88_1072 [Cercophora sp. LCS_1]